MSIVSSLFGGNRAAGKPSPKTIHGDAVRTEVVGSGFSESRQPAFDGNGNGETMTNSDNDANKPAHSTAEEPGGALPPDEVGAPEHVTLDSSIEMELRSELEQGLLSGIDADDEARLSELDEEYALASDTNDDAYSEDDLHAGLGEIHLDNLAEETDDTIANLINDGAIDDIDDEDLSEARPAPWRTLGNGAFSMGAAGQGVAVRGWQNESENALEKASNSANLAMFAEFVGHSENISEKLGTLDALISQSRSGFAKLQQDFDHIRRSLVRAKDIEADRERLLNEVQKLRSTADTALDQVAEKASEIAALNERMRVLDSQNDQRRTLIGQMKEELGELQRLLIKTQNERDEQKAHSAEMATALDRERSERASVEKAKSDLSVKHAKLQQHETDARTRLAEMELQNEKLTKIQRTMSGEQEKLRNELRTSHREKSEHVARIMTLEDEIRQLEAENETLKGRVASDTYAIENELELRRSALRISESKLSDAMLQIEKLERRVANAEVAKTTAEENQRKVISELEEEKRRLSDATYRLSDVNLKYMTDLVSFDSQREASKSFQRNMDSLVSENRRLAKFESLYLSSETQVRELKDKLRKMVEQMHQMPGVQVAALTDVMPEIEDDFADDDNDKPGRAKARPRKSAANDHD